MALWGAVMGAVMVLVLLAPAHATTLYKWVDENGNITYQDTPPPGDVEFEANDVDSPPTPLPVDAGTQIEQAALDNPVSLYSVPICDACDLVRLYLERNSIPFAEKNVQNNIDLQKELEAKAGALTVPTLSIGDHVLDGYSRVAISSALSEAGFPVTADRGSAAPAEESSGEDDDGEPLTPLEAESAGDSEDLTASDY